MDFVKLITMDNDNCGGVNKEAIAIDADHLMSS